MLAVFGLYFVATLVAGCTPLGGAGAYPGYFPTPGPIGYPPVSSLPNPGAPRCCNVGYPGNPSIPVVLIPTPVPGTSPGLPFPGPNPQPGTSPTIPVGMPGPEVPSDKSLDFWSPWPLPPRGNSSAAGTPRPPRSVNAASIDPGRSFAGVVARPQDHYLFTSQRFRGNTRQFDESIGNDGTAAETEDLKYRGGRTIRDLSYVNLYVSGDTQWSRTDVEQIDNRLSAAMSDANLNNVLMQYFENQPIRSTALASHPLVGYTTKTVTRGDIQYMVGWLHRQGFLNSFDLRNTVFNLLLPSGTVLTVDNQATLTLSSEVVDGVPGESNNAIPAFEEGTSLAGLAGYHGSVLTANGDRVYYTVSVYSERGANATTNGIPVFSLPWKNVVATLYHQLTESRTNPDAEEAMRNAANGSGEQYLGWVSDSGMEIADFPIRARIPLNSVFREVSLANNNGVVPIQLIYSNFAHGPEGPISQPHPLPSR